MWPNNEMRLNQEHLSSWSDSQAALYRNVPHEQVDWASLAKQWMTMQSQPQPQARRSEHVHFNYDQRFMQHMPMAASNNPPLQHPPMPFHSQASPFLQGLNTPPMNRFQHFPLGHEVHFLQNQNMPFRPVIFESQLELRHPMQMVHDMRPRFDRPPMFNMHAHAFEARPVMHRQPFIWDNAVHNNPPRAQPPMTAHRLAYEQQSRVSAPKGASRAPPVSQSNETIAHAMVAIGNKDVDDRLRNDNVDRYDVQDMHVEPLASDAPNNRDLIDAAKKKNLPSWIREGLEKMEREKLKQLDREKQEQEQLDRLRLQREQEAEIRREIEEETRRKLTSINETRSRGKLEHVDMNAKSPLVEETKFLTQDEIESEMANLVKNKLTEILLEVTDQEIRLVAKERYFKAKQRKVSATIKLAASTPVNKSNSALGGLLAGYGSDSDSDDNDSQQRDSDIDSDEELANRIRMKKESFYCIEPSCQPSSVVVKEKEPSIVEQHPDNNGSQILSSDSSVNHQGALDGSEGTKLAFWFRVKFTAIQLQMGIAYSCCSRKKIILFYAVLAVVFYISVITGCSLQLTLPKNDAGKSNANSSLARLCFPDQRVHFGIHILYPGKAEIVLSCNSTNLVSLCLHMIINSLSAPRATITQGASESVLSNMAFDITMAAIFMVGVILVSFAYISIRSSVQSAMSHNVYNHQQKAKLQFSSASRSTTINSQREKEETCQLNSQDTATTL
ncbi:Arginine/serine-rich protein PNISR [Halotydeus destructor]|nr:Arginine/serine-rich protein PNISR [Halotydeus destructor]